MWGSRCGALEGDTAGAADGVSLASGREWISWAKVNSPWKNNTHWWFGGWLRLIPLQEVLICSLVWELRSHMPQGATKKRNLLDPSTKINSKLIFKIYQMLSVYYMPGTVLSTLHVLYHYVSPPQPCELVTVIPLDR